MSQATIQQALKPTLRSLEYTPPACEIGSYPGWQFVFSLEEGSAFTAADVEARARAISAFDESKVEGGRITVKFIGTKHLDKPKEVDEFHKWLLRLTTERQWEFRHD